MFTRYVPAFIVIPQVYPLWHVSPPSGEDSGNIASTIGVMQALISVFIDDDDKLRCINAGNTRITFLIRSPLYFVCVSSWGEPESIVSLILSTLRYQTSSMKQDTVPFRISALANFKHRYRLATATNL